MEVKRIEGFTGATPKIDKRLIANNAAQEAANVYLTSGRLDPMTAPLPVQSLALPNQQTIYRMFNDNASFWLSWKEQVDVAESPVFVENNFRIAFTSPDFEPRQTDLTLASAFGDGSAFPASWYVLGVTPPLSAPTVGSVTGGSGSNVTRTYVYTFVTQWGEESAPSPASTVFSGLPDGTWNLTMADLAPLNAYTVSNVVYSSGRLRLTLDSVFGLRAKEKIILADLNTAVNGSWRISEIDVTNKYAYITMADPGTISDTTGTATREAPHNTTGMTKRIYRSITNAEGTGFYLVGADIPVATTTFGDNVTIIGEILETLEWAMPPANLEGLVVHPSGCMVGFRGNEVYVSEPYAPYAYKYSNVQVLDYQAIGMGVFAQNIIIGTSGKPYLLSFVSPETATPQKIDQNWPCLSKRGITAFNGGVYYPTTVGLAFVGGAGAVLITEGYYAQRDWELLNPETFISGYYDNRYYAIYTEEAHVQILIISDREGITTINLPATAAYTDRVTGDLYLAQGNAVTMLNAASGQLVEYSWTSKEYTVPEPVNLGAAKIDFTQDVEAGLVQSVLDFNENIVASNAQNLGSSAGLPGVTPVSAEIVNSAGLQGLKSLLGIYYTTFTLLVEGTPYFQKLVESKKVFRLPAGRKYDRYAVRLSGTAPISSVAVGDTPTVLKSV